MTLPDLTYPEGASCAIRVEGVRDETGALREDATVRVTLRTMAGVAVVGADDVQAAAVAGEAGTYEWIAPAGLALRGRYRLEVRATRGETVTPLARTVRVQRYHGENAA